MSKLSDERLAEIYRKAIRTLGKPLVQWHSDVFALFGHIDAQQERIDALVAERAESKAPVGSDFEKKGGYASPKHPVGALPKVPTGPAPGVPVQENDL